MSCTEEGGESSGLLWPCVRYLGSRKSESNIQAGREAVVISYSELGGAIVLPPAAGMHC